MEASISHFSWDDGWQKEPEPVHPTTQQLLNVIEELQSANQSMAGSIGKAENVILRLQKDLNDSNALLNSSVLGINHWMREYNRVKREKWEWIQVTVLAAIVALLAGLHLGLPTKQQTIDAMKGDTQSQRAQK